MQKTRAKTMAVAIVLILLLSITASLAVTPISNAQSTNVTYSFIGATPNPVGVGQEVLLHIGITHALSTERLGWEGLTVTVTKPDNTTQTLGPMRTDSTGGTGTIFVPTMVGTYYLQTHFPEQVMPTSAGGVPAGTVMKASVSEKIALIVTQEQQPVYPGIPLPTEYWTRPINAQFREWYVVAGSSWQGNDEYNLAPESPHVLWTKPLTIGGLVGGTYGLIGSGGTSVAFENGDAYEGKWSNRLILAGKLYYIDGNYDRPRYTHCVDLRTGEELWSKVFISNSSISFGQMMYWQSYNYQGTFAYLWVTSGSTWVGYDAFTGEWMANITNVPSGTNIEGERGELYRYNVNLTGGYMTLWNQSALVSMRGSWGSSIQQRSLNASGTGSAATRAWAWNISIPKGLPGSVRGVRLGDKVVGSSTSTDTLTIWAFSLKPGQEGQLLYNTTWTTPANWKSGNITFYTYGTSWALTDMNANVALVWVKEFRKHYAFNLENGQFMWESEVSQHYLDIYSIGRRIAYDRLYSVGQAGIVYSWDIKTGKLLWNYSVTDTYAQVLWSNNWPEDLLFINNGKLYFFHSEHSANQPLPRGAPALCLNATNGEVIWRVDGLFRKTDWGGSPIMGDSVIAMYNTYDQQVYAIGKGPSATTVTAGPKVSEFGHKVVIEGSVTDVSPGLLDYSIMARFPSGVPAVSDASQGEWMKHVYAQFPRPNNASGVEVSVSVFDANGNYREIGKTTSSSNGFYSLTWTPDIPGEYKVYSSFTGTKSYYPSHAETVFVVEESSTTPTASATAIPVSAADMYFLPVAIGLFIMIAIVGAVLALMLRKRA